MTFNVFYSEEVMHLYKEIHYKKKHGMSYLDQMVALRFIPQSKEIRFKLLLA